MREQADSRLSTRSGRWSIVPAIQLAVLLALLIGGLFLFEDWRRLLLVGTLFPISIIGVLARAGLPPYRSRLPRSIQILLAIVLIAGSIPAVFLGERFHLSGLIWVFVIPTLLPDALPTPLIERFRNAATTE